MMIEGVGVGVTEARMEALQKAFYHAPETSSVDEILTNASKIEDWLTR